VARQSRRISDTTKSSSGAATACASATRLSRLIIYRVVILVRPKTRLDG
jgi:hypothetical protein